MDNNFDQQEWDEYHFHEQLNQYVDQFLEKATVDASRRKIKPQKGGYTTVSELAKYLQDQTGISAYDLGHSILGWLEMDYELPKHLSREQKEELENDIMQWADDQREALEINFKK
jgi:hypothetical protein